MNKYKTLALAVALAVDLPLAAAEANFQINWNDRDSIRTAYEKAFDVRTLSVKGTEDENDAVCEATLGNANFKAIAFRPNDFKVACAPKRLNEAIGDFVCKSLDMKVLAVKIEEQVLICGKSAGGKA